MKFGPIPINDSLGKILGHNIAGPEGKRFLRKGRILTEGDLKRLREIGFSKVYVADLEPGDVDENEAARRISTAVAGPGIQLSPPSAGRVNLLTALTGVLRIDSAKLHQINSFEGITLSTRPADLPLAARKIAATLKIIPYALPSRTVEEMEDLLQEGNSTITVDELVPKRVGLIFSSSRDAQAKVRNDFEGPLRERVEGLGSRVEEIEFVHLDDETGEVALAALIRKMTAEGIELIVLAGETAIMDRQDIAPRAVERAGGQVECVGVPVDPGNLLMVAYREDIPILGAPGCARSRKINVIDWVLPRLLVGEQLKRGDLIKMGNGGLLEDTPLRPRPRLDSAD